MENEKIMEDFNLWKEASNTYYDIDSEPIMSDVEFDELTEKLKSCGIEEIEFLVSKSIQTSGGLITADKTTEMVSLFKIQFQENRGSLFYMDLLKFIGKDKIMNCVIGPKLDGNAIKVIISNSGVKTIQTRGGQDVTKYLEFIHDIDNLNKPGIYHGELVLPKQTFLDNWSDTYENPRNAVAGVMKVSPNDLRFIVHTDGTNPSNVNFKVWTTIDYESIRTQGYKYLEEIFKSFKNENYPYAIDGLVVGYSTKERVIKDNYPTNMVALKFPSPTAETEVIGFEWSQKKTGNLTPVYLLKPVHLDGTTVQKANGYNYETVKNSQCGIGSKVLITKSNDIIPVIKKVITKSNNIVLPDVDYEVVGKHIKAIDLQTSLEYKFVLGLKVLEIEGIGPTIAQQIGSVVNYDIIEIFNQLNKPNILSILGAGSTWNKFKTIYDTKKIPLDLMIEMLQFNGCGKILSRKFADILMSNGKPVDIKGIDKNVLNYVCKGDGFARINDSMKRLRSYGVNVIKPIEINDDTITYEMTGTPPDGLTKKEVTDEIKKYFVNSAHTTLTKNTTYLIVDSLTSSSSKANKARKYNVKLVLYSDIIKGKITE